jgi:hypothetical protein
MIRRVIKDIKKYNIKPKDDLYQIKPTKPYERYLAEEFFMAVKLENLH